MSPGSGPRSLALRVLEAVGRGRYLEPTLDLALEKSRLAGPDRGLATRIAYGVLQRLLYLDRALSARLRNQNALPSPVRWILRAGSYEKLFLRTPDYALVNEWVELAKERSPRHAGLVNAVLRRVEPVGAPPWVRESVPRFLYEHWRELFGDASFVRHFNEPPPLWVTAFPGAEEALAEEGVAFEPGPVPGSLRLLDPPLRATRAYRLGLVQPQNPASLLAAQLLEPGPGDRVLDLAGGAGIKAAWMASRGARVTSYDRDRKAQERGARNLERLGISVEFRTADLTRGVGERAPKVLLDAPCTGTGTIRHHPELRYRLAPGDPERMAELQTALLETAAAATEPGGVLVYSVCSLTAPEGERLADSFLARHPELTPLPLSLPIPRLGGGLGAYSSPEGGLDGFYYLKLRKS